MNKKIRIKRLKQLKYMLDNHSKLFTNVKFSIGQWCDMEKPKNFPLDTSIKKIPRSCGTAACALGSAALYAPLRKQGLKITAWRYGSVTYRGEEDWDAGAKFFGISMNESHELFNPCRYYNPKVSPKHVAERVGYLISKYK